MAEAIISGIITAKKYKPENIKAYDINKTRLQYIENKYKIICSDDLKLCLAKSDIILLAVKPQIIKSVLKEISTHYKNQIVISIAAGVKTEIIVNILGDKCRIIRVMPNTPALIQEGMSAICKGGKATEEDLDEIIKIFKAIGEVKELPESKFNAVTALSGSGPAYVFLMAEALMEAGLKAGLDKDTSLFLTTQTIIGASRMLKETGLHPAELKNSVSSPSGTTLA
ncbi:MAG: pyrroline-5-carboxylate reductase [Candidatus Firestonebacteria bacterium]|nr:pyrroline-5-carboxylate reductase [Candidatus Firestonebacteria bacterium]